MGFYLGMGDWCGRLIGGLPQLSYFQHYKEGGNKNPQKPGTLKSAGYIITLVLKKICETMKSELNSIKTNEILQPIFEFNSFTSLEFGVFGECANEWRRRKNANESVASAAVRARPWTPSLCVSPRAAQRGP